jgi:hypothetical protein
MRGRRASRAKRCEREPLRVLSISQSLRSPADDKQNKLAIRVTRWDNLKHVWWPDVCSDCFDETSVGPILRSKQCFSPRFSFGVVDIICVVCPPSSSSSSPSSSRRLRRLHTQTISTMGDDGSRHVGSKRRCSFGCCSAQSFLFFNFVWLNIYNVTTTGLCTVSIYISRKPNVFLPL